MTKKSYTQPTAVVVEMDTVDVLCASNYFGTTDGVTPVELDIIDWYWGEE